MKLNPQQSFWKFPSEDTLPEETDAPEGYLKACQPEYYIGLMDVSLYLSFIIGVHIRPPASILELGCGAGRNLAVLEGAGFHVKGFEINPSCYALAKKHFPEIADKIEFGSAEKLIDLTSENSYNVILTQGFLMHVPYENDHIFGDMRRVAKNFIITNEVETSGHPKGLKFPRLYHEYIPGNGWRQVGYLSRMDISAINTSTTRIFMRGPK